MKTGFLAELSNTDRLRDCRLPGVLTGDIISELLLTEGDLNQKQLKKRIEKNAHLTF